MENERLLLISALGAWLAALVVLLPIESLAVWARWGLVIILAVPWMWLLMRLIRALPVVKGLRAERAEHRRRQLFTFRPFVAVDNKGGGALEIIFPVPPTGSDQPYNCTVILRHRGLESRWEGRVQDGGLGQLKYPDNFTDPIPSFSSKLWHPVELEADIGGLYTPRRRFYMNDSLAIRRTPLWWLRRVRHRLNELRETGEPPVV